MAFRPPRPGQTQQARTRTEETRIPTNRVPEDAEDASRPRGAFANRQPSGDRRRMLDMRRESHFKYDLRELLLQSTLPPEQLAGFVATVVSKGSRVSTADAKEFVTEKHREKLLTLAEAAAINGLLDRYSKWR